MPLPYLADTLRALSRLSSRPVSPAARSHPDFGPRSPSSPGDDGGRKGLSRLTTADATSSASFFARSGFAGLAIDSSSSVPSCAAGLHRGRLGFCAAISGPPPQIHGLHVADMESESLVDATHGAAQLPAGIRFRPSRRAGTDALRSSLPAADPRQKVGSLEGQRAAAETTGARCGGTVNGRPCSFPSMGLLL